MQTRSKKKNIFGLFLAFILAISVLSIALAHETVEVGDYNLEYGWVNEPAVVGQPNSVVINISPKDASQSSDVDVSGLKIEAKYGGLSKTLTLQPLSEESHGQFIAPITPMRAGKYTIHLSGMVGKTMFDTDVEPEEIMTADVVQFPVAEVQTAPQNSTNWLEIVALILGLIGTLLGALALVRKPGKS